MNIPTQGNRLIRGPSSSLMELPEYIISTFFPQALPLLSRYPALFRFLGILLAVYYLGPIDRLQSLWKQTSSLLVSSISVTTEEDLFQYMATFIAEKRALRPNQSLNAITNPLQDQPRRRRDPEYEESARRDTRDDKRVQYEQGHGLQIFFHERRLFWVQRGYGEGHTYAGNRYRRTEVMDIFCLGRSVKPIKSMLEKIYRINKDREKSSTIIRRPYGGAHGSRGLNWSRLTSKRRRMLDTVILEESQKAAILADVAEYMSEATKTFYANHGIPYRRGYLFHGPPGCGKTSFCLALASKFNLDVYVLTLLDRDLNDTDLMSLLNQLPTPSLLLLEDVDEAGLTRKKPFASSKPKARRSTRPGLPKGATDGTGSSAANGPPSDDEDTEPKSQVTLSGLLNAIDGVAAPEGHILIMTTNKPNELDDALVRAGRISVRVAFSNATTKQATQIFERMYIDLPQYLPVTGTSDEKPMPLKEDLETLAKRFGQGIPEGDFSPADLQDYLLVHKKDPERAVEGLQAWIEEQYEERRRKDDEKEAEAEWKASKAEEKRRRFREDLKSAFTEEEKEELLRKGDKDKDKSASTTGAEREGAKEKTVEKSVDGSKDEKVPESKD